MNMIGAGQDCREAFYKRNAGAVPTKQLYGLGDGERCTLQHQVTVKSL